MKQLVVISGKGGTGKTSVVACLAHLAAEGDAPVVLADCDVDASNLGLLLAGEDHLVEPFEAGRRAVIDPELCIACGDCEEACRFDAITVAEAARADELRCEGCGACAVVCPSQAVSFRPNLAGHWMERHTAVGTLVHAELGPAQDNSGKLVAQVRSAAREAAQRDGAPLVIVDGPPGIGCPVHAALTGCDLALVVTEPTPSGEHDLARVLDLAGHFEVPVAVLINKADLSPGFVARIAQLARDRGAAVVGRLPFDREVPRLLARGEVPLRVDHFARPLRAAWDELTARL